jgi:tripartite-type tricarboxylate transporter receptor subunit TctC
MSKTQHFMTAIASAAVLAAGGMMAGTASAASVGEFYKGKTVKLIIGYSPGGGYDTYARAIGRHIGKHIPGNPMIVPQNMTGAGSRRAANYLYNIAPKDGSVIGTVGQGMPLDQAMGKPGVKYDAAKFNWIGNSIVDNNITFIWAATGIKTIDDAKRKGGVICGATGATSPSVTSPQIINNLIGTKFRIIRGYPGGAIINLALARGEVNCRGSNSWSSTKSTMSHHVEKRELNIILQWGRKKDPRIAKYMGRDVPLVTDFAKTDADRKALDMILAGVTIGRPIMAPPGVPGERVAALRKAFDATMTDAGFLALAKKQKMDINPMPGAEVQKLAVSVVNAPAVAKDRLRELLTPRDVKKIKTHSLAGTISAIGKKKVTITDASGKSKTLKTHRRRTKVKLGGKKAKAKNLKKGMNCKFKYVGGVANLVVGANCK